MILFPDKEIDAQSINLLVQSHTTGSGRAEIRIRGLLSLCGSRAPEGLWLRKFLKKILGLAAGKSLGVVLRNAYSWIPAKSYELDSWEVGPRICISISSLGTSYSQESQRTANLTLEFGFSLGTLLGLSLFIIWISFMNKPQPCPSHLTSFI